MAKLESQVEMEGRNRPNIALITGVRLETMVWPVRIAPQIDWAAAIRTVRGPKRFTRRSTVLTPRICLNALCRPSRYLMEVLKSEN